MSLDDANKEIPNIEKPASETPLLFKFCASAHYNYQIKSSNQDGSLTKDIKTKI